MNFKEKISIYYTSLTPTEKRICTMILDNPHIIIDHSIIEAGNLCHTSKSAMLRFAQKLEYRGYSEFKYAIEEYYNKLQSDKPTAVNHESILHQISSSYCLTIDALGKSGYEEELSELAQMIDIYPYVKAIGIGNSAFCAKQLIYSLYSHNKFFEPITDDIQFSFLSRCLTKDYLLIVFSVSGSSNTFLELLKTAQLKGAKVVLITMNSESVLTSYSDMNFFLPSNVSPLKDSKVLKQLDNRTTLYFFSEIISYYYGLYLECK